MTACPVTLALVAAIGRTLGLRAYRTIEEFAVYHPLARRVWSTIYHATPLGSGLLGHPVFERLTIVIRH